MKKFVTGLLAGAMALSLCACSSNSSSEEEQVLVVSSFNLAEDITARDVFEPFEEEFNCKVTKELDVVSTRLQKLEQNQENSEVDVIELSQVTATEGAQKGLFQEIDYSKIPNIEYQIDVAKELNTGYGPAYTVNALGIIYDKEALGFEITCWADLWKPELKGKIAIPTFSNTFGPAFVNVASDYKGVNVADDKGDAAFAALAELKPNIVKTYSKSADVANMMSSGEIDVAVIGDYAYNTVMKSREGLTFFFPENTYASFNTINITKNCKNVELAYKWINYRLSEEVETRTSSLENDGLGEVPVNKNVQVAAGTNVENTFNAVQTNAKSVNFDVVLPLMEEWSNRWNQTLND